MCKQGGIDHIIVDEPKRLSRNTMDSAHLTVLLEKKFIKSVITTGRRYKGDDSTDILLLDLDFGLSKKDNKDRSNEVRKKMVQAAMN